MYPSLFSLRLTISFPVVQVPVLAVLARSDVVSSTIQATNYHYSAITLCDSPGCYVSWRSCYYTYTPQPVAPIITIVTTPR
jgi:hypothetical protein